MNENYPVIKASSPVGDLSPENRRNARFKGIVTWNTLAPPGVGSAAHKFSFIDAVEMASRFLETHYIKDQETLILGRNVLLIVRTLPNLYLSPAPEGKMMAVYDGPLLADAAKGELGVVGKFLDRLVLWSGEEEMANTAKLVNSTSEVLLELVEEEYAKQPVDWRTNPVQVPDKKTREDEEKKMWEKFRLSESAKEPHAMTSEQILMGFVALLDEALLCDRVAIQNLLSRRVLCNKQLEAHPTIQVSETRPVSRFSSYSSTLGLINGICERLTGQRVCAVVDESGLIERFGVYMPPKEQDERKAAV
jgi:hypothetical protein